MPSEGEDAATAPTIHSIADAETSHVRVSHEPAEAASSTEDKYELESELGRGGMGVVIKARDKRLGRCVALKALHPTLEDDATVLRRFMVEAQVGAQLEHPNIVPVYELSTEDAGQPAFTMRLLGQRDPSGRTSKECAAPSDNPGRCTRTHSLVDAPASSSSRSRRRDRRTPTRRGVIHRDLKPANVVLGEHHEVYLVDWGIAKVLSDDEALDREALGERRTMPSEEMMALIENQVSVDADMDTATRHGELIGTPTYMPPEQASGQLELHGPASDQFALAMMLQELITLKLPRRGAPVEQVFQACAGERYELEEDAEGKAVPPGLVAIVDKATAIDVGARYESVEAFADDVRRFIRGEEVSVHPDPWTRRVWKRLSARPGLVLGGVTALILAASLAASFSMYRTIETQRRAAAQAERLSELSGLVVGRSESIDARFAHARTLVEGLGVAIEELLANDHPVEGELRYGVAGRLVGERGPPLTDPHPVAHYPFPVSWDTPLYLYPPEVPFEAVERTIRVMAPLDRRFRAVLLRSVHDGVMTFPESRQRAMLDDGEPPLHVTYVGFENGLLLNYPGYEPFPDDYDPRRRPWYVEAREGHGVFFGHPYPDASGSAILVPCNRPLHDPEGDFVGVAGADMALDDLARSMRIDHPAWIRSSFVDADETEIIDTGQEGMRLGIGLHDDAPIEARPVERVVLDALTSHATGFVRVEGELVVFDHIEAIRWTFVVRFDARQVL